MREIGVRKVAIDTETTGLSTAEGDRIVSVGCIEIVDGRRTGHMEEWFFNPGRRCSADATNVHGLTDSYLSGFPPFHSGVRLIFEFIGDSPMIAHNAPFDLRFLNHELGLLIAEKRSFRFGWQPELIEKARMQCTMQMFRKRFPGAKSGLDAACAHFNIDTSHRRYHGALKDAVLCAQLFERLYFSETRDLIEAAGATPPPRKPIDPGPTPPRPPFRSRLTAEERGRHEAFIATLGDKKTPSIWNDYARAKHGE